MPGLISVAGGIASSCFRIKGGNVQLMERALEAAKVSARVVRPAAGCASVPVGVKKQSTHKTNDSVACCEQVQQVHTATRFCMTQLRGST
eukprot:4266406-Amphidinium_carterae.1